jgi:hypothetical protein
VRLEGLGKLKKFNDLIGNRTRDLPSCSIVPQATTLPRSPTSNKFFIIKRRRRNVCSRKVCCMRKGKGKAIPVTGRGGP